MNKKTLISICLFSMTVSFAYARCCSYIAHIAQEHSICIGSIEEIIELTLQHREKENHGNVKKPILKSLVTIPEVTMQGNTLHFITPCYGCEFRLVQDDIVCYSTEIDGDALIIPAALHGTYELQIVSEYHIFYTEITLN